MAQYYKYAEIEPYNKGTLRVDDTYSVYYEESGNPHGIPVISFHGGPGGSLKSDHRRLFDPNKFRIILFTQRGCGGKGGCEPSVPLAIDSGTEIMHHNDQYKIVEDAEKIRKLLKIDKWRVTGGSWGAALALLYSIKHPEKVLDLVLGSLFLGRDFDIKWYWESLPNLFPEAYENLQSPFPGKMGGELLKEYYQVFWSASNIDDVRMFIIKWMNFENSCELIGAHMPENTMEVKENHWNYVRMLSYFSLYRKFPDDWYKTSEAIAALKKIDITIFHGRCDLLCPLSGVYDLFKNHPHMKLKVYDHVGHGVDTDGHMTEDLMIALNEIVE